MNNQANKPKPPEKGPLGTPIPAPIVKPSDTKKKGKGQGPGAPGPRNAANLPATAAAPSAGASPAGKGFRAAP